jgi:hypothetical protein
MTGGPRSILQLRYEAALHSRRIVRVQHPEAGVRRQDRKSIDCEDANGKDMGSTRRDYGLCRDHVVVLCAGKSGFDGRIGVSRGGPPIALGYEFPAASRLVVPNAPNSGLPHARSTSKPMPSLYYGLGVVRANGVPDEHLPMPSRQLT